MLGGGCSAAAAAPGGRAAPGIAAGAADPADPRPRAKRLSTPLAFPFAFLLNFFPLKIGEMLARGAAVSKTLVFP